MENATEPITDFGVERRNETTDRQLKLLINQLCELKSKYNLTPEQNRYVDKEVRNRLKLVISKRPKKLPTHLTPPEIYHFLDVAGQISSKHRLLCEILIMTGLRINELRNLDIRDIQSNNQILVREGKGHKQRYMPVSNSLIHKIRLFAGDRERGYIFLNRKNQQYTTRMLQYLVEQVIKKSGIDKELSTHSLRHTFACLCLARGLRLEDIKLLMGHSSIKTTEIYAKLELGTIKEKYLELIGGY